KDKATQNSVIEEALNFIKDSSNDPKLPNKRSITQDFEEQLLEYIET
ncbi:9966_t:CDS:2, partial [Dentiscutata heterogama]